MSSAAARPSGSAGRIAWRLCLLLSALAASSAPLLAQNDLEDSRRRLEEIRRERERLERERTRIRGEVHDLGEELDNLERQRRSTNRIVNELESQIGGLNSHVDQSSASLALAQDNLAEKRAVLSRRLAEIYKRGRLYTFEVLVAAQSFGDLLSRYKYLYLQSRQDKSLLADVEKLTIQVERRRREILQVRTQLDQSRRSGRRSCGATPTWWTSGPAGSTRPGAPPAPPSSGSPPWSAMRRASTTCSRSWSGRGARPSPGCRRRAPGRPP